MWIAELKGYDLGYKIILLLFACLCYISKYGYPSVLKATMCYRVRIIMKIETVFSFCYVSVEKYSIFLRRYSIVV